MCRIKNNFYIADIASTHSCDFGYPASNIDVLKVWQVCRTLVSASVSHVVDCATLEMGFQGECQTGSDKGVPSALGPVMDQDELE